MASDATGGRIARMAGIAACLLVLAGCAAPARPDRMVATIDDSRTQDLLATSPLRQQVVPLAVTGGEAGNPSWPSEIGNDEFRAVLERSLKASGLAGALRAGQYELMADLVRIERPALSLDTTATAHVRYRLRDSVTGAMLFDRAIVTPFTVRLREAFLGNERLRLATEGAIRENIATLIATLARSIREPPASPPRR